MPTVDFHPEAADEAVAAQKWYADIDPKLGVEFTDALERAIFLIETSPQRWTQHLHGTRCINLPRFPYVVIYRHSNDEIQVVAIQHSRRNPGYWKNRAP